MITASSPHRTAENLQSAEAANRSNWRADSTGILRRLPSWPRIRRIARCLCRSSVACVPARLAGLANTSSDSVHGQHGRIAYRRPAGQGVGL